MREEETKMKRYNLFLVSILFLILGITELFPQAKKELIAFSRGDSVIIIPSVAPKRGEGINFYRKDPAGNFVLLNTDGPVMRITDGEEIRKIFGSKWNSVASTLAINDPVDIEYLLDESEAAFFIISLRVPEIFRIAGAWCIDKTGRNSGEAEYKLEYTDKNGAVKESIIKKVRLIDKKPETPTLLKTEQEDNTIILKWDYPKQRVEQNDFTAQFYIYRSDNNGEFRRINNEVILRSDDNPPVYIDEKIENGIEYTYYVTAVDVTGTESLPTPYAKLTWFDRTPPAIPEEIKADSVEGAIGISWKMNLELDAKGYNVYRSEKLTDSYIKLNTEITPVDKTFYYDKEFMPGIQYFYRVTSVDNNNNESEKSNVLSIVYEDLIAPEPPENLTYTLENKNVRLSWSASKSPDVTGYHIYRGESSDMLARITIDPVKTLSYTDAGFKGSGFPAGKNFSFAVTAYDNGRNESQKVIIEEVLIPDDEPPSPPHSLITENIDGLYIQVSCGGSTSPDVAVYKLFRAELNNTPQELASFTDIPFQLSDTNVVKTKVYVYYTVAVDSAGNESEKSKADTVSLKDFTPPPSPRLVTARKIDEGIEITWEPSFDFDMAGYNIYKSQFPNGNYVKINLEPLQELIYIDRTGKTTEFYRVRAVDTSGNESTKGDYATPE